MELCETFGAECLYRPPSLEGLRQRERNLIVVTSTSDDNGRAHPVCLFGDAVWDLSPEVKAPNARASELKIFWPEDISNDLINDAKAVLYCALRRGRFQGRPWKGRTIALAGQQGCRTLRDLSAMGFSDFSQIRALDLSDYISMLRTRFQPKIAASRLDIVDLVWAFPNDVMKPLKEHPWAGLTLTLACGSAKAPTDPPGKTGKTPVIPRNVQASIFNYCEQKILEAQDQLPGRYGAPISAKAHRLVRLRSAILYVLQITTGMRVSEAVGVTNGSWRTEKRGDITFYWIRTREFKTGKGDVEFLAPPETINALQLLQRYAAPLQQRLSEEIVWLENKISQTVDRSKEPARDISSVEAMQRLDYVRRVRTNLFLCIDPKASDHLGIGSRVVAMSAIASNVGFKSLARAAGTEWPLSNHQCRRTFAHNVANSRLGRMGLVFLKWQLKHSSLSWTQLYASNPLQDRALYLEMEEEALQARIELIEEWMEPDMRLSGGAGRKLMQTRATPVKDIRELLVHAAESAEIRSTGHAWCLSGTRGCHGQGVYDATLCGGCSQAVIDTDHATTWQTIHVENLRLAAITDCGPAVAQKARRAIERSADVLRDLGVPIPDPEAST